MNMLGLFHEDEEVEYEGYARQPVNFQLNIDNDTKFNKIYNSNVVTFSNIRDNYEALSLYVVLLNTENEKMLDYISRVKEEVMISDSLKFDIGDIKVNFCPDVIYEMKSNNDTIITSIKVKEHGGLRRLIKWFRS